MTKTKKRPAPNSPASRDQDRAEGDLAANRAKAPARQQRQLDLESPARDVRNSSDSLRTRLKTARKDWAAANRQNSRQKIMIISWRRRFARHTQLKTSPLDLDRELEP